MDEEKEWLEKFNRGFGAKALLIILGFSMFIILTGAILGALVNSMPLAFCLLLVGLSSPYWVPRWKPTWVIYRKLVGNNDLPIEPRPGSQKRIAFKKQPLSFYVILFFRLAFLGLAIYLVVQYLDKNGF